RPRTTSLPPSAAITSRRRVPRMVLEPAVPTIVARRPLQRMTGLGLEPGPVPGPEPGPVPGPEPGPVPGSEPGPTPPVRGPGASRSKCSTAGRPAPLATYTSRPSELIATPRG